jgi:hypothetical protein
METPEKKSFISITRLGGINKIYSRVWGAMKDRERVQKANRRQKDGWTVL